MEFKVILFNRAFKTIESDITKSGKALSLFNHDLSVFKKNWENTQGLKNRVTSAFSNPNVISQTDLTNLQAYNNAISSGTNKQTAFYRHLSNSSVAAQNLAANAKFGTVNVEKLKVATGNLSSAQKVAAASSKMLSVALNTAFNIGIMIAINVIISQIGKLVNAEEDARQKAEDLRKESVANAEAYKQEAEEIKSLQSRYAELYTSVSDTSTLKYELTSLQTELVDKYGEEADKIDLVNGKYSEQIQLLQDLKKQDAQGYINENLAAYNQALKESTEVHNVEYSEVSGSYDMSNLIRLKAVGMGKWSDKELDAFSKIEGFVDPRDYGIYENWSYVGGTDEEAYDTLVKMMNVYSQMEGYDKDRLELMQKEANILKEKITDNETVISQYEQQIDLLGKNAYPQTKEDFNFYNLLDDAVEYNKAFIESTNPIEKGSAALNLSRIREEIQNLAGDNVDLQDIVNTTWESFDENLTKGYTSATALRTAFSEFLENDFKGTSEKIEKVKSAMQKLAEGEYLNHDEFWDIATNVDTDYILKNIRNINGEYKLSTEELIKLKDSIIKKEIEQIRINKKETEQYIENAKAVIIAEEAKIKAKQETLNFNSINSPSDLSQSGIIKSIEAIAQNKADIKEWQKLLTDNDILIQELNASLGNTVEITDDIKGNIEEMEKELDALEKQADELLSFEEAKADKIIDKLNDEKDVLNEQKEVLEEQLDALEEQQDEIESIIEKYETVADIVGDTIDSEIKSIEDKREQIEKFYDDEIEKLKSANDERKEAIDLIEKENALKNAENNKVLSYTESGGWGHAVDQDALRKAQNDLEDAKAEAKISSLEKDKDIATSGFDGQIKALEDYASQWDDIVNGVTEAENDLIAEQLLGSEWREKIKNQDTEIISEFKSNYSTYQSQLKQITDKEIKSLKDSITAKEKEIKAKDKQIESWQHYKTELKKVVDSMTKSWSDYINGLNTIELDENSSYEQRAANLQNFANNYISIADQIADKQGEIETANIALENLGNVLGNINGDSFANGIATAAGQLEDVYERLCRLLEDNPIGFGIVNSPGDIKVYGEAFANPTVKSSISTSGLDISSITAAQSKKLSDLTDVSLNMSEYMSGQIMSKGKQIIPNNIQNSSEKIANVNNNFNFGDIVANNPEEFKRQMDKYCEGILLKSKIY